MAITKTKILILGIGSIGRRHCDVLYENLGCRQLTLFDPSVERARKCAAAYPGVKIVDSLADGLAKGPDAVFITSPPEFHMEQALEALLSDCHVLVEKPLDVSFALTSEVKRLAQAKNKLVTVAFCLRYHDGLKRTREIVQSGILGKVITIRAQLAEYFPDSRPDYLNTHYIHSSGVFELIHAVDLSLWLAGGQPEIIHGISGSFADLGFTAPDTAEMIFQTQTGVICNVSLGFWRSPAASTLSVYGSEGSLELSFAHDSYTLNTYLKSEGQWRREQVTGLYRNLMFAREDREFLEDIVSGRQRGCTVADAERSLKIYRAVYADQAKEARQMSLGGQR